MDEGDNGSGSIEGNGDEEPQRNRNRISDITSIRETVHVLFLTDVSVNRRGVLNGGSRVSFCINPFQFQGSSPSPLSEGELATNGVFTILNFPGSYPTSIQVPQGNTIWIRFTDFECEPQFDTVTVTDRDGTRLGFLDGRVNSDDDWRKEIVSNSDTVEVLFRTDDSNYKKGWRLDWGKY